MAVASSLCLGEAAAAPTPPHVTARHAVVGGSPAAATDAPWAVWVISDEGHCSGSIISATEILTAAHCAGQAPARYRVRAGWRGDPRDADDAFGQTRAVTSMRTHPGYTVLPNNATLNDVAVLRLDAPFNLSGPRVRVVALASSPSAINGGLRLYGYGRPRVGDLRRFNVVLAARWQCGNTPVHFCGRSPDGMACPGDSGAGVVTASSPPQLVAVVDLAQRDLCEPGGPNGFADVTAPEIRRWIDGDGSPPIGPRRTAGEPSLTAYPDGGVRCGPGGWTDAPVVTFSFSDASTGAVLQDGAADTYRPTSQDAGRLIRCVASVTNAGGTAQSSPGPLRVPGAWGLAVRGRRVTAARFDLSYGRLAALTFTDVRAREVRRIALPRERPLPKTIPALPAGAYTTCLHVSPGGPFTAWRECTSATVNARAATLVKRVRTTRRGARVRVTLSVSPAAAGQRATATWLTARCRTCRAHRVRRNAVRLRARLTLRSPAVGRGRVMRLRMRLPEISVDGGRYTAGSKTWWVRRPGTGR